VASGEMASQLMGKTAPGRPVSVPVKGHAWSRGPRGQRVVIFPTPDSTMTWRRVLSDVVHGLS
jgi:hypothetical protein